VAGLTVVAVYDTSRSAPAVRLADELGIDVLTDPADLYRLRELDLILDLSGDSTAGVSLDPDRLRGVVIVSGSGAELLWELLVAKKRSEEQEKVFVELQTAYDKIRSHESRLELSKKALEQANDELEGRLAEIFFTHEFFKALTTFGSVAAVTSLIVDGANGILGAEIAAVYLLSQEDWTLRLHASQGRPADTFRPVLPVAETIVGAACRDGFVEESRVEPRSPSAQWSLYPEEVLSQVATPLRSGDSVIGVLLIASSAHRELTDAERDRIKVIANQSSLALQNALLHEELERLSMTDRLTDLYNHGYLHQRLDEEMERCVRFEHEMSLIMLDIDDFKQFNDLFGHPKGDAVLKAVSSIIRQNLREIDVAARYGGEEFVILLPETDIGGAVAVGERIRASMAQYSHILDENGERVVKTVSLGVANYPVHAGSAAALVEAADQAMYRAKRAGKNRVVVAS
jgi:diguanylate cyclase (GGDEF)-like protein